jgi:hypothetical protein
MAEHPRAPPFLLFADRFMITGKGPSQRHEIFYITETTLAAVRIDDYKYRFTE